MKTELGNFLRRLRLSNNEILKDMADNLGVSSAFLSAVENGKKTAPKSWGVKLKNIYDLSDKQLDEYNDVVRRSYNKISIDLSNKSSENKELAFAFARKFENINEFERKALFNLLRERSE